MHTERILGLDLATHSGYSVWHAENCGLVAFGDIDCAIRTESQGDPDPPGKRFDMLRKYVNHLMSAHRITHVFHERTVMGPKAGGAPALISNGMTAVIQQLCFERGLPCASVSTGTLKKHACGNGGPETKKQHMIAAALLEVGSGRSITRNHKPTKNAPWSYDDDVVDGIWVGNYGVYHVYGLVRNTEYSFELANPSRVNVYMSGKIVYRLNV